MRLLYRLRCIFAILILTPVLAHAAPATDATGRTIDVPDHPERVLPAGPPAAVLLAALAPDLMLGWPGQLTADQQALLSNAAATLHAVPRLTGRNDVTAQVAALKPDLIIDYGDTSPRYRDLAVHVQQATGIPTVLLDGTLAHMPEALRLAGKILGRPERAEILAAMAEALLSAASTTANHPRVVYLRAEGGLQAARADTQSTEIFAAVAWQVVVPQATAAGAFQPVTAEQIAALDPDVLILQDATTRDVLAATPAWPNLRAVREHRTFVAPVAPFGWITEPPSLNRLFGLAWLEGGGIPAASVLNTVLFGHAPNAAQLAAWQSTIQPPNP